MLTGQHIARLGCALLLTGFPAPLLAEELAGQLERVQAEIKGLKAGQALIQQDLQAIKQLLSNRKPPPAPVRRPAGSTDVDVTANLANLPVKGAAQATVTLIEYTDFQCPFCKRHMELVMPSIQKNFVDTGKIRYVLRDFPLGFHSFAPKAHEAAHCAGEQGKYWEMHHTLFTNQQALQLEKLSGYAATAGVADLASFDACLADGRYAELGTQGLAEGKQAGVRGTPSFVLGLTGADGTTVKGTKFIRGAVTYGVFEKAINELLASVDD